jgi:hypothetical protein
MINLTKLTILSEAKAKNIHHPEFLDKDFETAA